MFDKKRIFLATAAFFATLSVWLVIQNGDALAARFGAKTTSSGPLDSNAELAGLPPSGPELATVSSALPRPPKEALQPTPLHMGGTQLAKRLHSVNLDQTPVFSDESRYSAFGLACGASLSAVPSPAAMVTLTLTAPCHGNERVEISHEGLLFTAVTSLTGQITLDVPALSETPRFTLRFLDKSDITAIANVPDLNRYDRVAVQWRGKSGLKLHALEFGAGYGDAGHVWANAPRTAAFAAQARGGFITELGVANLPNANRAEVYSFPATGSRRHGTVRISVEAEINAYTCNRAIAAQTLQRDVDDKIVTTDLTLEMPDCASIGDILVLKNLLPDLKIAGN